MTTIYGCSTRGKPPRRSFSRRNAPGFAKLLDLEMLVLYNGGRERTRAEIEKLFSAAGFRLLRVVPTHSPTHVIEAERL
ncbi:methyltransferase [Mycobacterium riyadhense]|uniref:O-methyltransferase C-terminal domain-containing protein n=1 Tax=Mycobacterium riyadhense TaxID=486698 RepID=A0A653EQA7_9MYCO|nr:methyltransferase [Mycobacterium riyadhense]VTO99030.1 hypothetical protein BIN_B_02823 [Mycobacterium riyadhense]